MITQSPSFPTQVQNFFCQRLLVERNASPRTVATYRDAFRLFLRFAEEHLRKNPSSLTLAELDASLILAFLDHLERDRGNSIRSRNARLAALRSFFRYAASRDPVNLPTIQRVLAIPTKRHDQPLLGYLTREEVSALQKAFDLTSWSGRRDQALFATLYNTGARVSEIIALRASDFDSGRDAAIKLRGKGRKERAVPLWKNTVALLRTWTAHRGASPDAPLFPNRFGAPMTRSGVAYRLRLAADRAAAHCPSLQRKHISPHCLRHTTAMHLLQSGVDITVIALWLGHEDPTTTHQYVEADLAMKRRALEALEEPNQRKARFAPGDDLLTFLERL
jgi:integrase/recombinase XerD